MSTGNKKTLLCIQQNENNNVIIEINADSLDDFGLLGNALASMCASRSEVFELLKAVVALCEKDSDNFNDSVKQRTTVIKKTNNKNS